MTHTLIGAFHNAQERDTIAVIFLDEAGRSGEDANVGRCAVGEPRRADPTAALIVDDDGRRAHGSGKRRMFVGTVVLRLQVDILLSVGSRPATSTLASRGAWVHCMGGWGAARVSTSVRTQLKIVHDDVWFHVEYARETTSLFLEGFCDGFAGSRNETLRNTRLTLRDTAARAMYAIRQTGRV